MVPVVVRYDAQGSDERVSRQRKACVQLSSVLSRSQTRCAEKAAAFLRWRRAAAAAAAGNSAAPAPTDDVGDDSGGGGGGGNRSGLMQPGTAASSRGGTAAAAAAAEVAAAREETSALRRQHADALEESRYGKMVEDTYSGQCFEGVGNFAGSDDHFGLVTCHGGLSPRA